MCVCVCVCVCECACACVCVNIHLFVCGVGWLVKALGGGVVDAEIHSYTCVENMFRKV